MTKPKPLTDWQERMTPPSLPRHIRRNIAPEGRGCWQWTRSTSPDGYGWASLDNRTYQAHRLVYRLLVGDVPDGLVLDHLCRNRSCVNPSHLEPVTNHENLLRSPITTSGRTSCLRCGGGLVRCEFPSGSQRRCLECDRTKHAARARAARRRNDS